MTTLLEQAFAKAGKLSAAEQDLLAARLLAELDAEDEFDRAISASADKLAVLAKEALAEHRAGLTQELTTNKTFDCVEMKRRVQELLRQEYESHKQEFPSYVDFLKAKAAQSPWASRLRQQGSKRG